MLKVKPARVVHQRHLCTMSTGNSALLGKREGECGHQRQATLMRVSTSMKTGLVGVSKATSLERVGSGV